MVEANFLPRLLPAWFADPLRLSERRGSPRKRLLGAIILAMLTLTNLARAADFVYFTESQSIKRLDLATGTTETIVGDLAEPYDLAVDVQDGKIYWADGGSRKIQRANLDGGAVEDVVKTLSFVPLALDVPGKKVYWAVGNIFVSNLDGSASAKTSIPTPSATGVAIDSSRGKIYWVEAVPASAWRANLDGSGAEMLVRLLVPIPPPYPTDIALDLTRGKFFVIHRNSGLTQIQSANLDGSGLQTIVTTPGTSFNLDVDPVGGKIYFSNGTINRANVDGSALEVIGSGISSSFGVAFASIPDSPVVNPNVVYDNTATRLPARYASSSEFGDEIILAGTNRFLTNFTFEYFGTNFSGDEQARVRFYRNDGPSSASGAGTPHTLFYDTGFFGIGQTAGATLTLSDLGLTVPDSFTWTIAFSGVTAGESAGLNLYSPPVVGRNYPDFWEKNGSVWEQRILANEGSGLPETIPRIVISPAIDGFIRVFSALQIFDGVGVQVMSLPQFEDRGIIEFNLSAVTGRVTIAVLNLVRLASEGPYPLRVHVFSYSGNGALDPSDNNSGTFLTSFSYSGEPTVTIDVTSAISIAIMAANSFIGFRFEFAMLQPQGPSFVTFGSLDAGVPGSLSIQQGSAPSMDFGAQAEAGPIPAPPDGVVYDNSINRLPARYSSSLEFGDEIILAGTNRFLTNFLLEYFGTNFSGDERARVRFYRNDGPLTPSGAAVPNSLLYDTGFFGIRQTAGATLALTDLALTVPDSFTWTILFSGLSGDEAAGLDIYRPPGVGNNYTDFWENNGSGWELRTSQDGTPMDFGARAEAGIVPAFVITSITIEQKSGTVDAQAHVILTWNTVPGLRYTVEVSDDLISWAAASASDESANPATFTATSTSASWTDEVSKGQLFYRVKEE